MADMFDYLDWFGDFDFDHVPFNEVDNIILSQLSYLKLDNVLFACEFLDTSEVWHRFSTQKVLPSTGPLISDRTNELLGYMVKSGQRFANAKLGYYETRFSEEAREQFAALTLCLSDGSSYLSFRGTDDSLVGWIEDCDISYSIVPAQKDALAYLCQIASLTDGPLRVGGHSKGGNLAAYAVAMAPELDERIIELWCNDSPGFDDAVLPLSTFERLRERTHLFTPEYSLVAGLFSHAVEPVLVKSSAQGVMEHSAVNWQVMRDKLVRGDAVRQASVHVGQAFNELLASLDLQGRKKFVDELYQAFISHGIHDLAGIMGQSPAGIRAVTDSLNSLDENSKHIINSFLWNTMGGAVRGAAEESAEQTAKALAPVAKAVNVALSEAGEKTKQTLAVWKAQTEARIEGLQTSTVQDRSLPSPPNKTDAKTD